MKTTNRITLLSLVLLIVAMACDVSTPAPAPAGSAPASPKSLTEEPDLKPFRSLQQRRTQPPSPVDTRTPEQIAAAACAGRCVGRSIPKLLGAGANPILPPSWSVATWVVDPANSATCAVDTNSGTAATCSGGCSGATCPSGIGPIRTFQELSVHRWGCLGNPSACPRLRQATTITVLSSASGNTDPWYLAPAIENSGNLLVQGQLPATAATGTLLAVTAKNQSTGQLLKSTFTTTTGAFAAGQLLVNATHASRAMTWNSAGGGALNLTQPNQAVTTFPGWSNGNEVNTWANGDSVSAFAPVAVDIVSVNPMLADTSGAVLNNGVQLSQLTILDPQNVFGFNADSLYLGANASMFDCVSQRAITRNSLGQQFGNGNLYNVLGIGGIVSGPLIQFNYSDPIQEWILAGGYGGNAAVALSIVIQGVALGEDVIIGAASHTYMNNVGIGAVYVDTGVTVSSGGTSRLRTDGLGGGIALWGPGTWNIGELARVNYSAGAGAGAAQMLLPLTINGQTKGCIAQPGVAAMGSCNTACATGANLDTANGATPGCCGGPGFGFCNYGP